MSINSKLGLQNLRKDLSKLANPQKAQILQRFFKTGPGQYGEGDVFLGITVPQSRSVAIEYKDLPLFQVEKLLKSKIHEERLIALLILVHNFRIGDKKTRNKIYNFYLRSTRYINNWDLVDLSADKIVGEYLLEEESSRLRSNNMRLLRPERSRRARNDVLIKLAQSHNLWERRIAIIATFQFIKNNKFDKTFEIAKILLNDKHDLIHKAVGWMLREIGKRDQKLEETFLKRHYQKMPRTALRYAVERFDNKLKKVYLS